MNSQHIELNLTSRHSTLTDPLREHVRGKLDSIALDFPKIIHAHVILDVQKHHQSCEIVLLCNGHARFQVSHESDDMYASIDRCMDKLARRMKHYKERAQQHGHHFQRYAFRRNKHGIPCEQAIAHSP